MSTTTIDIKQIIELAIEQATAQQQNQIDELTKKLENLTVPNNVTDYKKQTIDPQILDNESLDIIKSLPTFEGSNEGYVSWREACQNSMSLYTPGSRRYFAALSIMRNKIVGHANSVLTSHGTVLNLEAILSRLDFAYADKRPIHVLNHELSMITQGRKTLIEFYNEVTEKLTLIINKVIMTYGTYSETTEKFNESYRKNALIAFINGLHQPMSDTVFSMKPEDLPNALAQAQELESNKTRSKFLNQYNQRNNIRNETYGNTLRYQQKPQNSYQQTNRASHQSPDPMELGSSAYRKVTPQEMQRFRQVHNNQNNPFRNTYNQFNQNRNSNRNFSQNNNQNDNIKREREQSVQLSSQPPNKVRINNIQENHFLDRTWDYPTYTEE